MDRIMKESDMRSMTTNENYRALLALTEEFECVSLRDDLGNFERERMLSIGDHVKCLSSAESDSRYVHEDVHCRDADGCLEYNQFARAFYQVLSPTHCSSAVITPLSACSSHSLA